MTRPEITVIGSVNMDIHGAPTGSFVPRDSNPGFIRITAGGVGCNIARNLSRLGRQVCFITAIGDDLLSVYAKQALADAKLDYSRSLSIPGGRTSCYLYVTDESGSMVCAVSDMQITQALTPDALQKRLDVLQDGVPIVFDANLSAESIRFLAEEISAPLIADSVSAAKAKHLLCALHRLSILKCNELEALALTDAEDVRRAAQSLVEKGVRRVFITLGAQGACCADERGVWIVPGVRAPKIINTTGAGDAFLAGAVHMFLKGTDPLASARFAAATAAFTCASDEPVHPELHEQIITRMLASEE